MGADESKPNPNGVPSYLLDGALEHCGPISCMALNEDESILATGSDDRSVRIWTTKTPRCSCIGILTGHEAPVTCVLIEEIFCISSSVDCTVRKWDMATCVCMAVFDGHTDRVNRLISTGDFIFSSSSDATVRCWDLDDGRCIRTFVGHAAGVFPLQYVVTDDEFGESGGREGEAAPPPCPTPKIRDLIVTGSTDGTARAWSFETGRTTALFSGHTGPVTCVGTDADDRVLVTASTDGSVRTWELKTGNQLGVFEGHRMPIVCMTIVDGKVYTGSSDTTARAFSINGSRQRLLFQCHEKSITCIKLVDQLVFTGGSDNMTTCFDAKTGEIKRIFRCPAGTQVNAIQIVDGRLFVGASDNVLRVYTLRGLRPFKPTLKPIAAAALNGNRDQLQQQDLQTEPPSRNSASNTDSSLSVRSSGNTSDSR